MWLIVSWCFNGDGCPASHSPWWCQGQLTYHTLIDIPSPDPPLHVVWYTCKYIINSVRQLALSPHSETSGRRHGDFLSLRRRVIGILWWPRGELTLPFAAMHVAANYVKYKNFWLRSLACFSVSRFSSLILELLGLIWVRVKVDRFRVKTPVNVHPPV